MAADAKRAALKVLVVVVLISGTVNFLAPGAIILRIIFAIVVALVAGVEWVAGKIRPDFAAIEIRETELTTHSGITADIPARLIPAARIAVVQHRQATGEHITEDDLATRLNTTQAIAGRLLATIATPQTPARINGTPVLGGAR